MSIAKINIKADKNRLLVTHQLLGLEFGQVMKRRGCDLREPEKGSQGSDREILESKHALVYR